MRDDLTNNTVIEIVETNKSGVAGTGGFIKPNEVRINGQKLWAPEGEPIKVHQIEMNSPDAPQDDAVKVTLTLYARRVFVGHADESSERPDEAQP